MQVRSQDLFQKLERLGTHYTSHVASPHLKAEFSSLVLSRRDWDEIELITARQEVFRHQGYHLDELYLKLLSLARFVHQARTQLAPTLRARVANRYSSRPSSERLMAEMATANFVPNLGVLASMVLDVFVLAKQEDASQNKGQTKFLSSVPEAQEIDSLLQP